MTWRNLLRPGSLLLDAVIVGVLIVAANLLFDPGDPGWSGLNPSPYLLLPLLVGGRYGFTPGVLSGAAASLLVLLLPRLGAGPASPETPTASVYLLASFPFVGGLVGELFGWFRRDRHQMEAQLEKAQTSVRALDGEVSYLRGVKDELDRLVAARDGEISSLDNELRRLYTVSAEDLPAAVLQFLRRQVRLHDAALYRVTPGQDGLRRLAVTGQEEQLPPTLDRSASPVVALALERHSLVLLPELLRQREPPVGERVLLACPLPNASGGIEAVLVVTGLPFVSFTNQAANLIDLVCEWAGEVLDLAGGATGRYRVMPGAENQRIFTRGHFEHLLGLALTAYRRHRLPSSVVVFTLRGASAPDRARFEQVISQTVRAGDYAAELGHPEPHLAVLLPLVGERGTNIFIERSQQFLRGNGPWTGTLEVRRIEFGQADEVAGLLAAIDGRAAVPSP